MINPRVSFVCKRAAQLRKQCHGMTQKEAFINANQEWKDVECAK